MTDITITPANVTPSTTARLAQANAAVAIDAGESVYTKDDGTLDLADATDATKGIGKGVAVNSAAAGQPCIYCYEGEVDYGAGVLTQGLPYLTSDTPGAIRPHTDLGSAEYAGYLGVAKDDSTLIIKPHAPGIVTA